ncbi:MAG: hypothetical protein INH41_04345, partial [Myxococcaceae bacterium]|nr:hypothetical protein [Myxococcaceae bacterium]
PPPPPPLPSSADAPLSNARVAAFVLIGVGVASATAGLVLDLQGADRRASVASLLQPSGRLPDPSSPAHREALDLLAVVAQQRTVAYSVMGAGLGALASGIVAFLLFPGTTSSVAVAPGPAGASVSWASFF